nr:hypothetical protein [uncultured Rhodopila sp.]
MGRTPDIHNRARIPGTQPRPVIVPVVMMRSEAGLDTAALTALRRQMEEAAAQLACAESPGAQRAAMTRSLIALSEFLVPLGCDTLPLLLLVGDLHRLDRGANPLLFQKTVKPAGGRPGAAPVREVLEGLTVAIVRRMIRCGEKPPQARTKAANVLHKAGIQKAAGDGRITSRTIESWDARASAQPDSIAAEVLRDFPAGKPIDPNGEIDHLLRTLERVASRTPKTL